MDAATDGDAGQQSGRHVSLLTATGRKTKRERERETERQTHVQVDTQTDRYRQTV